VLYQVHNANLWYGPVFLGKVDLADGFYHVALTLQAILCLAIVFPRYPGEEQLIAAPLVLPMGWVKSVPYFCMATETVVDMANSLPRTLVLPPHPLEEAALTRLVDMDTDNSQQPSCKLPVPITVVTRHPRLSSEPAYPVPGTMVTRGARHQEPMPFVPMHETMVHPPSLEPASTAPTTTTVTAGAWHQDRTPSAPYVTGEVPQALHNSKAPMVAAPPKQQIRNFWTLQPFQKPVSFNDIYMDDYLLGIQGTELQRQLHLCHLLHSIDTIFQPMAPTDSEYRKHVLSIKKFLKGDAYPVTQKVVLGWVMDMVHRTMELLPHRQEHLTEIFEYLRG